jgi:hypothetical protein
MDAFDLLIARVEWDLQNRSMALSRLHGVGRTVLLNYLRTTTATEVPMVTFPHPWRHR